MNNPCTYCTHLDEKGFCSIYKKCRPYRKFFAQEWRALQVMYGVRPPDKPKIDVRNPKTLIWRSYQNGGTWDERY